MPEHLRSLAVILVLAAALFAFAKVPACASATASGDFERRRNLWFGITLAAFLAHNFWIFMVLAAALLLYALPREPNKLAMYFLLVFAVPAIPADITGLGVIKSFFTINYIRLLALALLLPAFLSLRAQPDTERFGRTLPDKFLIAYLVLQLLLMATATTFTNALRHGVFYSFIDVFLPYYVASRSLKDLRGFRDALMGFVAAALVLSAIGAFEFARQWLLYASLDDALGVRWDANSYLERQGTGLRAVATTGHSLALGYVMAVAGGFFLYLGKSMRPLVWYLCLAVLAVGLLAPVSRGPWVGAAGILLVFVAAGPSPGKGLVKLGLLGLALVPVLLLSPWGEKFVQLLPFVGTVESENVLYRQRLLEISIQVILQNPFFGGYDYFYSPAMQELKQGQGIIDVVNSYLGVGLSSGLVGLSLYVGFFLAVLAGLFRAMRALADRNDEAYLLGRVLLATLLGILAMIFTVSSITVIPVVYWCVAGLGVAYVRMLAHAKQPARAPATVRPADLRPAAPIGSR